MVRTRADPAQLTKTVLAALKKVDPNVAGYRVMTMQASIAQSLWQQALYGKMLGAFAAIALLLAAVGVYVE